MIEGNLGKQGNGADFDHAAREVTAIVEQLWPTLTKLLAGKGPAVQAGVLADLAAIWLSGHFVEDNAEATRTLRAELLAEHVKQIGKLTTINAKIRGFPT